MALPTLHSSSPPAVYGDTSAQTSLVTASFTPPAGAVIEVDVVSGDAQQTHSGVTGTGHTFTSRVNVGTSNATTRTSLWTAIATGSALTVTAAYTSNNSTRSVTVKVYDGAQLAATPAVGSVVSASGAPSGTITTVGTDSLVSWHSGDWTQKTGAAAYRSSATQVAYKTLTGEYTSYSAYQAAVSAGSQTFGMTSPTAQTYTMAAIEIQASGGAAAARVPIQYANRARLIRASHW